MNLDTTVNHRKWFGYTITLSLILLILFMLLGFSHETLTKLDLIVMEHVWDFRNELFTSFFIFITYVGSGYVSIPLAFILAVYFIVNRKHRFAVVIIFNLVGVRFMNGYLKGVYGRARPDENPLIDVGGLSFPSGHTMNSTAFIGLLGYLLWVYFSRGNRSHSFILVIAWTLIFLIGLSRVYLGVHFPSDVIAGFAAGGVWLLLSLIILRIWQVIAENRSG